MCFTGATNDDLWRYTALISLSQIDPNYVPGEVETRQVYGVSLQQKRNDARIDAKLYDNIVSKNKDVRLSPFLHCLR